MCGSLKLERMSTFVTKGGQIDQDHLVGKFDYCAYKWVGHARIDGSRDGTKTFRDQWSNWKPVLVKVTEFTETDKERKVHKFSSQRLAGIINERDKELRILTRPAKTPEEMSIHHRMPVRISNKHTFEEFITALNEVTK